MLIFGGNNFDAVNELFAFDIARHEWSKLEPSGTPPRKRYGHQAVITADGRMVVFGGYNGSFDDVHELHTGTLSPSWRRIATSGTSPSARDGHSAVLAPDGYTMLVFGGFDGKNQLDDLAALDTKTFKWSHPQAAAPETVSEASEGNACGRVRMTMEEATRSLMLHLLQSLRRVINTTQLRAITACSCMVGTSQAASSPTTCGDSQSTRRPKTWKRRRKHPAPRALGGGAHNR